MKDRCCPCCSDWRVWGEVEIMLRKHGADMEYCPVCGQHVGVLNFLRNLRSVLDLQTIQLRETIEDENGKPMTLDRTPWSKQKHTSLGIDLDKIDISRELQILEKHQDKKNAEILDFIAMRYLKYGMSDEED